MRAIQPSTENYGYGFPLFTWIVTLLVTHGVADCEPCPDVLAK